MVDRCDSRSFLSQVVGVVFEVYLEGGTRQAKEKVNVIE